MMRRRPFLLLPFAAWAARRERLLAQVYIFVQDAQRRKAKVTDEVNTICETIAGAGYRGAELMWEFFDPLNRERTMAALRKHRLQVPIVYSNMENAVEVGEAARDAGCVAINVNPRPKPKGQRKSDEELATQSAALNRLGEALNKRGQQLLYHTHDPEMAEGAREWRYTLRNTDPALVHFCMDTHWIYRGGQDPIALLREAGKRTGSLHLRNSTKGIWSPEFGPGDMDYDAIKKAVVGEPYLVVELAYEKGTEASWNLREALARSRAYAKQVFKV